MKSSRSKERKPPPGNYTEHTRRLLLQRYQAHVTLESQRLYLFCREMEEAGVPESKILEALELHGGHPAYGMSYLRSWCLRENDEYKPDLGPSGNTVI